MKINAYCVICLKYKEKNVIFLSIGIIVIKSRETKAVSTPVDILADILIPTIQLIQEFNYPL